MNHNQGQGLIWVSTAMQTRPTLGIFSLHCTVIFLSVRLPVWPVDQSVYLPFFCLSVCCMYVLSFSIFACLSGSLSATAKFLIVCLNVWACLSVFLPVCLSVCLYLCLYVSTSVCLYVCLPVCLPDLSDITKKIYSSHANLLVHIGLRSLPGENFMSQWLQWGSPPPLPSLLTDEQLFLPDTLTSIQIPPPLPAVG